jgi:hypothetical protein
MSIEHLRHVLKVPLIIYSNEFATAPGILPIGTSLRYLESLSEGIDRYHVLLNVERFPLALEKVPRADLVEPITSFGPVAPDARPALAPEDLAALLHALNVSRADLERLVPHFE